MKGSPSCIFTVFGIHFFVWWILGQGRWIASIWFRFEILLRNKNQLPNIMIIANRTCLAFRTMPKKDFCGYLRHESRWGGPALVRFNGKKSFQKAQCRWGKIFTLFVQGTFICMLGSEHSCMRKLCFLPELFKWGAAKFEYFVQLFNLCFVCSIDVRSNQCATTEKTKAF